LSFKVDLHVHTCYSSDCTTTLEEAVIFSKKKGLNGIAITDHDTVEGALQLLGKKNKDLVIIPGIETSTNQGHILGINVTTTIPSNLTIKETIVKIHEAGGIAIAAHPSAIFKGGTGLDERIVSHGLDGVEVVNSSAFPFFLLNYLNKRFADRTGLPRTAGSDSHLPDTIGLAYTIIRDVGSELDIENMVRSVKKGMTVPFGRPTPWKLRFQKITRKKGKMGTLASKAGVDRNLRR
jgi:predicted metal-dependent phosphoesterase TrpH